MNDAANTCERCRWGRCWIGLSGECWRYPPTVSVEFKPLGVALHTHRPTILKTDAACGEYEPPS